MSITPTTDDALSRLVSMCTGEVVVPEDPGFDHARASWNVIWDHTPALVVQAKEERDVVEAVRYAADHGLAVVVQATGHGVVTPADRGSLLLQLAAMDQVHVDPIARTATLGGGATWEPVVSIASDFGLAPLVGSSPYVGAVGYTLGGGFGWLARKHGLAVDTVRSLRVVLADGQVVTASPQHEPDLFWALCGAGGGSLGVVVEMTVGLANLSDVYAGSLFYPFEAAREVFDRYRAWSASAPVELTSAFNITRFPPLEMVPEPLRGQTFAIVRGCHCGDPEQATELVDRWRDWQAPLIDGWGLMPFTRNAEISQDPVDPVPAASSGRWLRDLDDAVLDAMLAAMQAPTMLFAETRHAGGRISQPDPRRSFSARDASYCLEFIGLVTDPTVGADLEQRFTTAWSQVASQLAPMPGYLNFVEGPERLAVTSECFAADTLQRLRDVKRRVDPTDLFSHGVRF